MDMAIIDLTRKPKATPVARQYATAKVIGEMKIVPPKPGPDGRISMARLSFGVLTEKEDRSVRELYNYITHGPFNPRYLFPDTCFITSAVQQQFWEFGSQRFVAFPEAIVSELSAWLETPFRNSYLHSWLPRAFERCGTAGHADGPCRIANVLGLVFNRFQHFNVAILRKAEMLAYGYDYYVQLLSVRKRIGIRIAMGLAAEQGREPTDAEMKTRLQRDFDERVASIAFKGWKDQAKPNFMADEKLVVSAVVTAIVTGQPTLILTRDNDVFDQFTKLFELIIPDYYCYRFAEVLYHNPDAPMFPDEFEQDGIKFIDSVVLPRDEVDRLPPYEYKPVHAYCALVGGPCTDPKISLAGYCLEREMTGLLETKTETNGKNTRHFPGRNIGLGATGFGNRTLFARCEEGMTDYEGVSVTTRDRHHAINSTGEVLLYKWIGGDHPGPRCGVLGKLGT
jgi:hypothetical protein